MYTDGQIITNEEHIAFANWNNTNGNKYESIPNDDGTYTIKEIIVPEPTPEELQARVRSIRNNLLNDTDKYVSVPDFPIDESTRNQYIEYRQYLRDYTESDNWWLSEPLAFDAWVKTTDVK